MAHYEEHSITEQQEAPRLDDFADSFVVKCTLGQMIHRYLPLNTIKQTLIMRPYQVRKPSWAPTTKHLADNFKSYPL